MNAKEVAKLLGVHPNTVYNMIRSGEISAEKKGRSFEIPESEVKQLKNVKGLEDLAIAQERASMQLIVNINSEIESDLGQLRMWSGFLEGDLESKEIKSDDYSIENYEKLRKLYEEDELSPIAQIVETSANILRLENLRKQLEGIMKESEKTNTFEKSHTRVKELFNFDPIGRLSERLKGDENEES